MKIILLVVLLTGALTLQAQNRYTISGYIKDAASGEALIGANVYHAANPLDGSTSNVYGFYSLTLEEGQYDLIYSYTGYQKQRISLNLRQDSSITVELGEGVVLDSLITVTAEAADENVNSTEMGTIDIAIEEAKKLPVLFGEVDIIKTIQLLPGVLSSGEGNAGFNVRGGNADQNLVLLDEAVVYNPGHLFGFFSIFNADAIKNVTLIKGGMPANYGGRLSSVLDIQMKEGNQRKFGVEGGIGAISSRLLVEGPLVKDRSAFMVSGRRTYAFDVAQPFLKGGRFEGTNYYFYDLNLKANHRFSDKDRLFLSGYFGRDVLMLNAADRDFSFDMPWGNATATLRWNHLFNDKLFMNVTAVYNDYNFELDGGQDQFRFKLASGVRDYNLHADWEYYASNDHKIKFGADYTYHIITPSTAEAFSDDIPFEVNPDQRRANEFGLYLLDDWRVSKAFSMNMGLRLSGFQQVGPYTSSQTGQEYNAFEPVETYFGVEPRFSAKLSLNETSSLKTGVTLANQYLHLVSNSASTLPTDVWVASSELVRPQIGAQYALGYFRNFLDNSIETSVEVYYKDLYNQLDFAENYTQQVNDVLEEEFITGRGRAYGIELLVRKRKGAFTGWVAYTLSRSERIFDGILGGVYLSPFDRTHDLSLVGSYDFAPKWNVSGSFVFGTGSPYTPIESIYLANFIPRIRYGLRNAARLPDYHRLDFSLTYTPTKGKKKPFESSWVLSVYNVYNRRNAFFIYTQPEIDPTNAQLSLGSYRVSLFPIIPSITWNFKWKQP